MKERVFIVVVGEGKKDSEQRRMKSSMNSESRLILHLCVYSMQVFLINPTRLLNEFDVHVTVHRDKSLVIKQIRCTNFSNLFLE